ncbi:MAG: hypothetical protein J5706_07090 [Elusimicrobiales bacterium]|nr:hypothetical protein [Elusimicrobiales bacterium]
MVNLPYNLREGQVAYALKVMANFRALLGAYNNISIDGIGTGDIATIIGLLRQAMVMADEEGNSNHVVFPDGETLTQKYAAGTLNASLLDSEGLFYFYVDPTNGHLFVTASEGMEADNFEIDPDTGHLLFNLNDPDESNVVHTYDLGQVKGDKGDAGAGGMQATTYDPNGVGKDMNTYTGFFICYADKWGGYFLTEDTAFVADKTYYTYDSVNDEYTAATVTTGAAVLADTYYEKLSAMEYRLSDDDHVGGATLTGHITPTSGHYFMGPADDTTDDAVNAWSGGQIRTLGQGTGSITIKALGDIPEEDVDLQVTMFV